MKDIDSERGAPSCFFTTPMFARVLMLKPPGGDTHFTDVANADSDEDKIFNRQVGMTETENHLCLERGGGGSHKIRLNVCLLSTLYGRGPTFSGVDFLSGSWDSEAGS